MPVIPVTILIAVIAVILIAIIVVGEVLCILFVIDDRIESGRLFRFWTGGGDTHLRAFILAFGLHFNGDAIAAFDLGKIGALGVEQIDGSFGGSVQRDERAFALGRLVLDQTQRGKARAGGGADEARAVAMRTFPSGGFEHAGAQALAAHFHQAEAGNAPDLNARAIVLQRILHAAFDFADIGAVIHVDEVDHHKARHIAQAQLAGDFLGGFEIGVERGLLDPVLLGGAARVDVDTDQRLCRVDNKVSARFELHHGFIHGRELVFRAVALEQRDGIGIGFHPPRMAGHQQLHEGLGGFVARFPFDDHFLDLAIIDVANGALNEIRIRMDHARCAGSHGAFANLVPQAGEIVEIALDLGLGAAETGGADDQPHRFRQAEIADNALQPLAIRPAGNLARNAAAMAGVRHQHAITPGKAEIGRQRRAFIAALFLDDLDEQHLTALDDVLDLVAATQCLALGAGFVDFLGAAATATAAALPATALRTALAPATATTTRRIVILVAVIIILVAAFAVVVFGILVGLVAFDMAFFDRGDVLLVAGVDFLDPGFVLVVMLIGRAVRFVLVLFGAELGLFLCRSLFLGEQRGAVLRRDLVIIRVDFAESEEAVAIAAKIDESRLQRGFDPRDFR